MNEPKIDQELDRLLSGGGLGAPAEEQVLDNVLAAVAAERSSSKVAEEPRQRRPLLERLGLWLALPTAAVATAAVALWLTAEPQPVPHLDDEFRARGETTGDATALRFDVRCGEDGCRPGGQVVLTGRPASSTTWSAAALGPDDVLVWLFSGESARAGEPFAYQALWPADLAPGRYRVVLLVEEAPPSSGEAAEGQALRARRLARLEAHAAGTAAAPEVVVEMLAAGGPAPGTPGRGDPEEKPQ